MHKRTVAALAPMIALGFMLAGCSSEAPTTSSDPAPAGQETPATGTPSTDVHPDIARAAEFIELPVTIEALSAIDWEFVTLYDQNEDDSIILELSGPNSLKPQILSWLDAQDWTDWYLNDSDDPNSWAIQRYLGNDYVSGMEIAEMEIIQLTLAAVPD